MSRNPKRTVWVQICLALLVGLTASGCGQSGQSTPTTGQMSEVTIFAASSLTDALGKVKTNLETDGKSKLTYNFAGSQALVTQLSQGAKADLFASADAKNMDAAIQAGVVETGTQKLLVTNKLVVAVRTDSTTVKTLKDLATPGLKLVLAAPSVPAGNYSLQSLDKLSSTSEYGADFRSKVEANVVSREDNVRQVVAKVGLGEADAAIVYSTDARGDKVNTIAIPDEYNVVARYFVAPLKESTNPTGGQQFIEYLLSDIGQKTLQDFGFGPAK